MQTGERMTHGASAAPRNSGFQAACCTRGVKLGSGVAMQLYRHHLKAGSRRSDSLLSSGGGYTSPMIFS